MDVCELDPMVLRAAMDNFGLRCTSKHLVALRLRQDLSAVRGRNNTDSPRAGVHVYLGDGVAFLENEAARAKVANAAHVINVADAADAANAADASPGVSIVAEEVAGSAPPNASVANPLPVCDSSSFGSDSALAATSAHHADAAATTATAATAAADAAAAAAVSL